MQSKKTRAKKKAQREYVAKERAKVRNEFGYTRMMQRGIRSSRVEFPDYSCISRAAPTSDQVGNGFAPKPLPEDAKKFPVGVSHKQGPMLITATDRLEDMGGKKT